MSSTPSNEVETLAFTVGQRWAYRAPSGFEGSRIVIGAITEFPGGEVVACCAVLGAPRASTSDRHEASTIPFLPLSISALAASVTVPDGEGELPAGFAPALEMWLDDRRGLSMFTVPFDGHLDRLIARQMAEIVGRDAG